MKLTTKLLIVVSFAVVALSFAASPAAAAGEDTNCLNSPQEFCNEDLSEFAFSDDCGDCYDCPSCDDASLSQSAFSDDCGECYDCPDCGDASLSSDVLSDECSDCYDCPLCGSNSLSSDVLRLDSQATRTLY